MPKGSGLPDSRALYVYTFIFDVSNRTSTTHIGPCDNDEMYNFYIEYYMRRVLARPIPGLFMHTPFSFRSVTEPPQPISALATMMKCATSM